MGVSCVGESTKGLDMKVRTTDRLFFVKEWYVRGSLEFSSTAKECMVEPQRLLWCQRKDQSPSFIEAFKGLLHMDRQQKVHGAYISLVQALQLHNGGLGRRGPFILDLGHMCAGTASTHL